MPGIIVMDNLDTSTEIVSSYIAYTRQIITLRQINI